MQEERVSVLTRALVFSPKMQDGSRLSRVPPIRKIEKVARAVRRKEKARTLLEDLQR